MSGATTTPGQAIILRSQRCYRAYRNRHDDSEVAGAAWGQKGPPTKNERLEAENHGSVEMSVKLG